MLQQGQLARRDSHGDAADLEAATGGVEGDIAGPQHDPQTGAGAPQQGPASGRQLGDVEGLDEVVVGADVQSGDPVAQAAPGGQDQDRDGVVVAPQPLDQVQAVAVWQPQVEEHEVVGREAPRLDPAFQGLAPVHHESILGQALDDQSAQTCVVLNQQQAHG